MDKKTGKQPVLSQLDTKYARLHAQYPDIPTEYIREALEIYKDNITEASNYLKELKSILLDLKRLFCKYLLNLR